MNSYLAYEEDLIGGLLNRADLLPDAQSIVSASDFQSPALGAAFEWLAEAKLKADGGSHDALAFLAWVKKSKVKFDGPDAGQPGGQERIARRLLEHARHGAFVESNAKAIANEALFTRLARLSDVVADEIRDRDRDDYASGQAALDKVAATVADIQTRSAKGEAVPIRTAVGDALREIESRLFGQTRLGVETGFPVLDRMLSGLRAGQLTILAARPSVGKSALAGNIAANVAEKHNGRILFASLEMSQLELIERMLSSRSGIDHQKMRVGDLTPVQRSAIVQNAARVAEWDIAIDDRANLTVADVIAQARRKQRKTGLDLIVIDYLQLIQPADRRAPRQEQVASIARALKLAAKSLKVPVLCLAQLNRQADNASEPPRLAHLRESGAIEQDADNVLFIHRATIEGAGDKTKAELIIAKQRNGPTGSVNLLWEARVVTFLESAEQRKERIPQNVSFAPRLDEERNEQEEHHDGIF